MTPAEEIRLRREAQIKRSRRIDALAADQLANFIHRLAAIVPGDVDRVLGEFDANTPRPRTEKMLHPVTFYSGTNALMAYCSLDPTWNDSADDGSGLPELERLIREHSGIEPQ